MADYSAMLIYNNKICRERPDILQGNVPSRMKHVRSSSLMVCSLFLTALFFTSCYKNEIQFGNDNPDSFNKIITIDTITPVFSTFVLDSFPTSGNGVLLVGRFNDPVLGPTSARTFFQVGLPASTDIALLTADAIYDSIAVVLKPNTNYYGDTAIAQTYTLLELAEQPDYTYQSRIYNTSSFSTLPQPLATISKPLTPSRDSLSFRLSDLRGKDFFDKLRNNDNQIQTEDNFLNFFKGFCVQVNNTDKGAIYTIPADNSATMRIYFHTTNPYFAQHTLTFPLTRSSYQFNQLLANRDGTPLKPSYAGQQEFFATPVQPYAYSQSGMGLLLKVKFPSLKNILTVGSFVRLLSADLVLRPVESSFDLFGSQLPSSLTFFHTDASNVIGYPVVNAGGQTAIAASPVIDNIYRINTNYSFSVTPFIDYLLNTSNTTESGAFILQESPGSAKLLHRAAIGSSYLAKFQSQLKLTVLTSQ